LSLNRRDCLGASLERRLGARGAGLMLFRLLAMSPDMVVRMPRALATKPASRDANFPFALSKQTEDAIAEEAQKGYNLLVVGLAKITASNAGFHPDVARAEKKASALRVWPMTFGVRRADRPREPSIRCGVTVTDYSDVVATRPHLSASRHFTVCRIVASSQSQSAAISRMTWSALLSPCSANAAIQFR